MVNESTDVSGSSTKSTTWSLVVMALLSAIAMAMILQFVLIGTRSLLGAAPPKIIKVADLISGIAWGSMVASALMIGIGSPRSRARAMAILGAIGALSGFAVSACIYRLIDPQHAISTDPIPFTTLFAVIIKAIEYGLLGFLLGRSIDHGSASIESNIQIGALIAAVFGGILIVLTVTQSAASIPLRTGLGLVVNEVLLPIGCAFLAFVVGQIVAATVRRDQLSQ